MRSFAALFLVVFVSVAAADGKKLAPAAQAHLNAGLKMYGEKQYEKAAAEFELAYGIDPEPSLLYAGAQALRLGNLCAKALPLYKKYLEAKLTPDQVTAGKAGVEQCEAKIAKPVVEPPKPIVAEPPVEPVRVEPKPVEGPKWYRDPIGGALVVAGAVGLGVGLGFTVIASGTEKDARAAEFRDDFVSGLDKATSQRRLGAIALIAGGALVAGGVVRYLVRTPSKHVAFGTTGTGVFVAGWFR